LMSLLAVTLTQKVGLFKMTFMNAMKIQPQRRVLESKEMNLVQKYHRRRDFMNHKTKFRYTMKH